MAPQPSMAQQRGQQQLEEMKLRLDAQEKEQKRLSMFMEASNELSAFESAFRAKAESWMIAAKNVGSAYSIAAAKHRKVLNDQKESDALSDQIMFSVFAALTVGGLSWLSSAIQKRGERAMAANQIRIKDAEYQVKKLRDLPQSSPSYKYRNQSLTIAYDRLNRLKNIPRPKGMLIEAFEDFLQAAGDNALGNLGPQLVAEDFDEVSANPDVFQNQQENPIGRVKILAFNTFARIRLDWRDKPIEYWKAYDAKTRAQVHAEWLREANTLAGEEDLLPVQEMANELERGFWKKYILEHHSHRDFGVFKTDESFDYVGHVVKKRLGELGVKTFGGAASIVTAEHVRWAMNYQVKSLLKNAPKVSVPAIAGV